MNCDLIAYFYAVRLKGNQILYSNIEHLLTRPARIVGMIGSLTQVLGFLGVFLRHRMFEPLKYF